GQMKPLIGVTMNLEVQPARNLNILDQDYGRAVLQAGGIPVPILGIDTSIPDIVKRLDGFVFTGGDDIHPRFYKERPLSDARMLMSPDGRTTFEIALFKAAARAGKPVLAICYGTQLVNIALGGKLYQDIALQVSDPIKHVASSAGEKVFHFVDIFEGTLLSRIMGASRIRVRSAHHQSVKNPGRGLHLSAVAHDGVIEALEPRTKNFLIAVQWHPEKTPNDRYSKKLFKALVSASKK
ncbi:MAG TPA: gamma-glutamyl-gamma-aminobutyrate hydrolase family protein, partial [Nitrospirota bacterium]|nr:gamma-glutamyl-gamma-aminobutyrate hydrolase family protein [Nitrospirota bacterium]